MSVVLMRGGVDKIKDVLTAYLKNSVTRVVEPLRVIACLFACFEAIAEV